MSVTDELAQLRLGNVLEDAFKEGSELVADVLVHLVHASVLGTEASDSQIAWARAARSLRALELYCKQREEASR